MLKEVTAIINERIKSIEVRNTETESVWYRYGWTVRVKEDDTTLVAYTCNDKGAMVDRIVIDHADKVRKTARMIHAYITISLGTGPEKEGAFND